VADALFCGAGVLAARAAYASRCAYYRRGSCLLYAGARAVRLSVAARIPACCVLLLCDKRFILAVALHCAPLLFSECLLAYAFTLVELVLNCGMQSERPAIITRNMNFSPPAGAAGGCLWHFAGASVDSMRARGRWLPPAHGAVLRLRYIVRAGLRVAGRTVA